MQAVIGKRWLRGFIGLGLGLAIALAMQWMQPVSAQVNHAQAIAPPTEIRGVWLTNIDSDVLFSRRNVTQAVRRLHRLNFNTIYPAVWNWGYTLYPSAVAERIMGARVDPHPGLQNRDLLEELVRKGHNRNLTVIPWFEFGLMAPADSEIARRHPDWISQRSDGSQVVMEGEHPRVWFTPAHPEVQQMIVDLITEIVANYDVDGLQLDDHFGMPVELGYDAATVQLYQQEHQGRQPPLNPRDAEWMQWRASKMTDLMRRVFEAAKAAKPDCIVSVAPNSREFSYQNYLQDWWTWERTGYVEELILQVYRDSLSSFVTELERPEIQTVKAHIPVAVGILTGLKNRPVAMPQIEQQVKATRDRQFDGVSFFFYETLGDRNAEFRSLFPQPAPRPSLP